MAGVAERWLNLMAVAIVFSLFFYWNSYICDDAFFSFTTIDNFVRGYGLRWNVAERVQVFTSPLHTLIMAGLYWFIYDPYSLPNPTRIYFTAIAFNYVTSLTAILWLSFRIKKASVRWPIVLLLMSSQAFVSFTSSGLEVSLTYLLVVVFYVSFLWSDPRELRDYFWMLLWAALSFVVRMDTALLFLPAVCYLGVRGFRAHGWRFAGCVAFASLPLLMWFGFALVYYGSFLPNTYYAKIGVADTAILHSMGLAYMAINFIQDPITLPVICLGIIMSLFGTKTILVGLSSLLYVAYIYHIGGDFLGFRFLAAPFFLSTILIAHVLERGSVRISPAWSVIAVLALLVYGATVHSSPLRLFFGDKPSASDVRWYYEASNLARWSPGKSFPFAAYDAVRDEAHCRAQRELEPKVSINDGGLLVFCAGPSHHFIAAVAFPDPLLARLPLKIERPFKPGHVFWPIPAGYATSIRRGENLVDDEALSVYYDKILRLTRGPLFTKERWRNIFELNFTDKRRYSDPYIQASPPLPAWYSIPHRSNVEQLEQGVLRSWRGGLGTDP